MCFLRVTSLPPYSLLSDLPNCFLLIPLPRPTAPLLSSFSHMDFIPTLAHRRVFLLPIIPFLAVSKKRFNIYLLFFLHVCVSVCVCVCICTDMEIFFLHKYLYIHAGAHGDQKRTFTSLDLNLQTTVAPFHLVGTCSEQKRKKGTQHKHACMANSYWS